MHLFCNLEEDILSLKFINCKLSIRSGTTKYRNGLVWTVGEKVNFVQSDCVLILEN